MKRNWKGLKRFGHQALGHHVVATAERALQRHGVIDSYTSLEAFLQDRECVRFPTELIFAGNLAPGLFADAEPIAPSDAQRQFRLTVHSRFEQRPRVVPYLVAYHIPSINYGKMASVEDAESYGATLFGIDQDAYYAKLCRWADELM